MTYTTFRRLLLCFVLLVTITLHTSLLSAQIRVACIGNSITYGYSIEDREHDSYPAQLQAMLGSSYQVMNYGVSGTTAQQEGDFPWTTTKEYQAAKAFLPQICVIKLGTNDSKDRNWAGTERFIQGLESLAKEFEQLESHPQIIIALPAKAYRENFHIRDSIIAQYELPAIRKMAKRHHWPLVELYKATGHMQQNFPDGIHPNPAGATVIAKKVKKAVKKCKVATESHFGIPWKTARCQRS